jgi:PAS domain S-box-containing protein
MLRFRPHSCPGHSHRRMKETVPPIVEPRPPEARTARWTAGVRKPFLGQGLAVAAVIAAVALRWLLDPVLGDALPLVTLFGAVAGVAWFGGYRPAITAALLGYVACWYLFMPTRGEILPYRIRDLVGLSAYGLTCALIIGFGETMRRAQHRASERGELLRVTLSSIGDAVVTTDVHGRVTYLNAVAESLTGWSQAEAVGQPLEAVFRVVDESTRQVPENPAARALREGAVVGLANHTTLVHRDGSERSIDDSAAPIRDEFGHVSGCVLIFRDVTPARRVERDRAGQLLTARFLASIVESSDDAIISKSLEGVIQSWNDAAERLFGWTAAEAVGRHISLVIPKDRLAEEDQIIASLKAGRRIDHFETERVHRDGRRIPVSLTISPIRDDAGRVVGASKIVRDVTRQRQAEAEREKFVTLVESSTDFVGMCDLEGVPFFVNRAGLEMVGLDSVEAARATPVREFFFPEDQPRVMDEFFPSVLGTGHGEIEVRFRHFKTGEARWMAYKVVIVTGAEGKPVALATVSQDVTERKRMEDDLRRLAADLSEAGRRKDEFVAMLAHELRSPLAPISNAVEILRLAGSDESAVRSASGMLERQVGQMARLVDDLLDMSRITRGQIELRKERVELRPILDQAVESARALYKHLDHEITVRMPKDPIDLDADPARLAQVVGNLLNNACKFTDTGGHIWLTAEREGSEAVIRVRDRGIGIAAEHLPRLFDMFTQVDTSLERSRDGLGIGLTLVKTLVEMHGGTVEARSDGRGRGSEFVVRVPIPAVAAEPRAPARVEAEPVGRRRVLIVDDNRDGAESLAMMLRLKGHETETAHDGLEAVEAAERFRPDAMLLDIGLPRMNGYEVCRRIRERPWGKDVVLVAVTGWGQDEDRNRSKAAGFDTHVVKPVDRDVLGKLLASVGPRDRTASS